MKYKSIIICFLSLLILLAATNLNITGPIEISTNGSYNIAIGNGGSVNIKAGTTVHIQNLNINAGAVGLNIEKGAIVTLDNLHANGGFSFTNHSDKTKIPGSVEMQNGGNLFYSDADIDVNNFQMNDNSQVIIKGCEVQLHIDQQMNIHNGTLQLLEGAELKANGLLIDKANAVSGQGFIQTTGNFVLNAALTASPGIFIDYNDDKIGISLLGAANRSKNYSCPSLPVVVDEFIAKRTAEGIMVIFRFSDLDKLSKMRIVTGLPGKQKIHKIFERSNLKVGVRDTVFIPNSEL